jgi:hypothetical protein
MAKSQKLIKNDLISQGNMRPQTAKQSEKREIRFLGEEKISPARLTLDSPNKPLSHVN